MFSLFHCRPSAERVDVTHALYFTAAPWRYSLVKVPGIPKQTSPSILMLSPSFRNITAKLYTRENGLLRLPTIIQAKSVVFFF